MSSVTLARRGLSEPDSGACRREFRRRPRRQDESFTARRSRHKFFCFFSFDNEKKDLVLGLKNICNFFSLPLLSHRRKVTKDSLGHLASAETHTSHRTVAPEQPLLGGVGHFLYRFCTEIARPRELFRVARRVALGKSHSPASDDDIYRRSSTAIDSIGFRNESGMTAT